MVSFGVLSQRFRSAVLAGLVGASALQSAGAVPLVGTNGTSLFRFDSSNPSNVSPVQITGMQTNEKLVGIDYRPKNGLLYGVGTTGRLYTLDVGSGAAQLVAFGTPFPMIGSDYAMAIDPVTDQLRLIQTAAPTGANFRVDLDTGIKIADDNPVVGPAKTGTATTLPGPSGIAYSNHYPAASTTTCYAITSSNGVLYTVGDLNGDPTNANSGELKFVGNLTLEGVIDSKLGFDIAPDGTAYAAINYAGEFALYKINLTTGGFAQKIGNINTGFGVTSFNGLAAQTGPQTFNSGSISIPGSGDGGPAEEKASPYPSTITVSGMAGKVKSVRVKLKDFRHTKPGDVDIALVAPPVPNDEILGGVSSLILMSDVGGNDDVTGIDITLDDAASTILSFGGSFGTTLTTGTYKPTNYGADDPFPAPAPEFIGNPQPAGSDTLKLFKGSEPNGQWRLYVVDDANSDTGSMDGWELEITSAPPCEAVTCPDNIQRDNTSGQCGRQVQFPRAAISGACGKVTYSKEPDTFFPVGVTTVNVTTDDTSVLSGGSKSCSFTVTVKDIEAPTITCRADLTVPADPGQNSTTVFYDPPTITDNCGGATASYNIASGSVFGVGTTPVTGTVTDKSGNVRSCTFNVTVTPNSATPTPTPGGGGTPGPGATPGTTKLANISTRLRVEQGDDVLIGGFIVTGNQQKKLIVRAIGPSLPIGDRLLDPELELYNAAGELIGKNNNWQDALNAQEIADSTIAPTNALESAVLGTVPPGAYTAIVSGVNGGTGVGLVEAYDLSLNAVSKFANIATRGSVQTGENVMIGGFIVVGPNSQNLLVRAIGTSLPIGNKLADPQLQLFDSNGDLVAENDNWRSNQEGEIAATGIPPSENAESAVLVNVAPAAYTAIVRGANDGTGVGLVEVYALD